MNHVTVIANDKGGVSKSQLTVQLAGALARQGKRVLVVDLDPQANATRRLGIDWTPESPFPTTSEAVKSDKDGVGEQVVIPSGWVDSDGELTDEGKLIDVLPARFDLVNREHEAGSPGSVLRLRKALKGWTEDRYDVTLIDTQPSLGHLTQLALCAANTVLIPCIAEYDSAEAAMRMHDFVKQNAYVLYNPELEVKGVVITRYKARNEYEFQAKQLRQNFGDLIWELKGSVTAANGDRHKIPTYLPELIRYGEADSAAVSMSAWGDLEGRKSVGVYDALAKIYTERVLNNEGVQS